MPRNLKPIFKLCSLLNPACYEATFVLGFKLGDLVVNRERDKCVCCRMLSGWFVLDGENSRTRPVLYVLRDVFRIKVDIPRRVERERGMFLLG